MPRIDIDLSYIADAALERPFRGYWGGALQAPGD
jgi:hypothetical protein